MITQHRITVCIPTLNAGPEWATAIQALARQGLAHSTLIVDSGSSDETRLVALQHGNQVVQIDKRQFDHGATRQLAVELSKTSDFIVFMTQDAVLADDVALERLIEAFNNPNVGAAFGRQLPRAGANDIEAHARLFNYPPQDRITSADDIPSLGMRAAFLSNSFAAYRMTALLNVGGFPPRTLVSEDMIVGARMLLKGWKIAYQSEACVFHSHGYSLLREFQRYFDIGALHSRESWLLQKLGGPGGEGLRFVLSELRYLSKHAPLLIPEAMLRTVVKYLGYRLGRMERYLSPRLKMRLSMQKAFWNREIGQHAT